MLLYKRLFSDEADVRHLPSAAMDSLLPGKRMCRKNGNILTDMWDACFSVKLPQRKSAAA